jgi:hypothetical protein
MASSRRRSRACGTAFVVLLAMALWLASTLGLVHRVVHAPTGWSPAGGAVVVVVGKASGALEAAGPTALFGDHQGGSGDCRLYDQLAAGAAAPSVPFVMLPVVLPTARFHYFLGEALLRWVVLFDARGPPANR